MTEIFDTTYDQGTKNTTLTRICLITAERPGYSGGQHRVRATVRRNFYEDQSYAKAEVLTPELTWTHLINSPTQVWWEAANMAAGRKQTADPDEQLILENVADDLVKRAAAILP